MVKSRGAASSVTIHTRRAADAGCAVEATLASLTMGADCGGIAI